MVTFYHSSNSSDSNLLASLFRIPDLPPLVCQRLPHLHDLLALSSCSKALRAQGKGALPHDATKLSALLSNLLAKPNSQSALANFLQTYTQSYPNAPVKLQIKQCTPALIASIQAIQETFPSLHLCIQDESLTCELVNTILNATAGLKELDISDCKHLSTMDLQTLALPQTLRRLNLSNLNCNGVGLERVVRSCPQLESLHLSNCLSIAPDSFACIGKLSMLKELNLDSTSCSLASFQEIFQKCTELVYLNLARSYHLSFLSVAPKGLKELDVHNSSIDASTLAQIFLASPELKRLNLTLCHKLTAENFADLAFPETLSELDLMNTQIDAKGVANVATRCRRLRRLNLDSCRGLTPAAWQTVTLPSFLKELNASDTGIEGKAVTKLQNIPLYSLILGSERSLPVGSFAESQFAASLKRVDFHSTPVSVQDLLQVKNRCPALVAISLRGSPTLSAEAFTKLQLPESVEELDVSGTQIADLGLLACVKQLPELRLINISRCKGLSKDIFRKLPMLKRLQELDASYTSITQEGIESMQMTSPRLFRVAQQKSKNPASLDLLIHRLHALHLAE